jgi:8-oxo-dGTP diphosphatase
MEDRNIDAQVNLADLRYCPRCAGELAKRRVRGHERLTCPDCGYVFYMTPAPVTCVLVVQDERVLLVRRRYTPKAGDWCLPAGFVEIGESPEESAVREVREETGLEVRITGLVDSWASREDPRTPVVSYAFTASVAGGTLRAGDDAEEAAFFEPERIPANIAFSTHRILIERLTT